MRREYANQLRACQRPREHRRCMLGLVGAAFSRAIRCPSWNASHRRSGIQRARAAPRPVALRERTANERPRRSWRSRPRRWRRRPPRARAYIQYGVAFTVEGVAHAGPACADHEHADASSGRAAASTSRVGWRPTGDLLHRRRLRVPRSKIQTSSFGWRSCGKLRLELRHYFPTGKSVEPFVLFGGRPRLVRRTNGRWRRGARAQPSGAGSSSSSRAGSRARRLTLAYQPGFTCALSRTRSRRSTTLASRISSRSKSPSRPKTRFEFGLSSGPNRADSGLNRADSGPNRARATDSTKPLRRAQRNGCGTLTVTSAALSHHLA